MADFIIGIDQSTQGTKAMLFDRAGNILFRADRPHRQIVDGKGWVEHDPEEIWQNILSLIRETLARTGTDPTELRAVGISNQRETALVWERDTGKPVYNAVVWQCARGASICGALSGYEDVIRKSTGLRLSPYFSAAKIAWILRNVPGVMERASRGEICCGTMDSYLIFRMTGGREFRTDYSNASRTQLFNIHTLTWDPGILSLFAVPSRCMAEVTDSDAKFGETDFDGILPHPIPIHSAMGDSHAALFAQGCVHKGMVKATYGTGSSIMMNIGREPLSSEGGLVTSLAWKLRGRVSYVLEGNINYAGAVITWLKDQAGLLGSAAESETLAEKANPADHTYLVPSFSGLGAPYWRSDVSAAFIGMSRTTGRAELVKAGLEAIAYQITDIVEVMRSDAHIPEVELRADGGASRNKWLMQFQSDMLRCKVLVPDTEELSCAGAAYAAGIAMGLYTDEVFSNNRYTQYGPRMDLKSRNARIDGWKEAVKRIL